MGVSAMQSYGYESFSMTITIIEYNLIFKVFLFVLTSVKDKFLDLFARV